MPSNLQTQSPGGEVESIPPESLWFNLARAAAAAGHELEVGLRPLGLSPTQYNVLRVLHAAGSAGLCQHQIGQCLAAPVPDVPRILDRMERAAWVQRKRSLADRRLVVTRLTPAGLSLAAEAEAAALSLTSQIFSGLSAIDMQRLNDLLAATKSPTTGSIKATRGETV